MQPKRASRDVMVPRYSYLRVHAQPKRFPAAYETDWQVGCLHAVSVFTSFSSNRLQLRCTASEVSAQTPCCAAQSRIIHLGDDFVVVSKPPGIPVVPCVCNVLESCLTCAAQVGLPTKAKVPPSMMSDDSTVGGAVCFLICSRAHNVQRPGSTREGWHQVQIPKFLTIAGSEAASAPAGNTQA